MSSMKDDGPPHPAGEHAADSIVLTRLSSIEPEDVNWLWPGRLARGHFTLVAGDPGGGKTSLLLDCAARLSRGSAWPDGSPAPQGLTLFATGEDDLKSTIRPRVDRFGGDSSQVIIVEARDRHGKRPLDLVKDLRNLADAIRDVKPALIGMDPITAFLGRTDSHRDSEVRGLLAPLIAALQESNAALMTISHMSKGAMQSALYRPGGSIAFVAAARLAFAVAADHEDEDRRILAPLKTNLCEKPDCLAFRIEDGVLVWEDGPVVGVDAEQLLGRPKARKEEDPTEAEQLLRALLDDASRWPLAAASAFELASQQGIQERTLRRAAKALGIRAKRQGFGPGSRVIWEHPSAGMSGMSGMENQAAIDIPAAKALSGMGASGMEAVSGMQGSDSGEIPHTYHTGHKKLPSRARELSGMERLIDMPHPAEDEELS
jgi:putative DNA primase/helicase